MWGGTGPLVCLADSTAVSQGVTVHRLPLDQVLTTILMNNKTEQDETSGTDQWQPVPCCAAHLPAQHCSRAASSVLASSPSLSTGRQRAALALQGASLRGDGDLVLAGRV